ncbi:substrate-binding periplasmic protein [Litoribacillus peritrichatus]|uniref:Transporter substrate-binding domain-containing protein n=1 Tax=Litoribacillus peritrichatus TaxID=718191 RepID=A0ABP7MQS5_9GAMM
MCRALIALLLMVVAAFSVHAETIKLTNGDWPPYLSKSYKHQGVVSHIVQEAFKRAGVDVEYGFFPWARAYKNAQLGVDWQGSVVWSSSEERVKNFIFSDPVIFDETVFFHLASKEIRWGTLNDLSKYRIGYTRSYYHGDEFARLEKEGVFNVEVATYDENNFRKLLAKRIDLFPLQQVVGMETLRTHFSSEDIMKLTYTRPFRRTPYFLIISKNVDGAQRYIDLFNQGLSALRATGQYQKFLEDNQAGLYRPDEPTQAGLP